MLSYDDHGDLHLLGELMTHDIYGSTSGERCSRYSSAVAIRRSTMWPVFSSLSSCSIAALRPPLGYRYCSEHAAYDEYDGCTESMFPCVELIIASIT